MVDEERAPIVRLVLECIFDPRREPRTTARKRLLSDAARLIDSELDRLTRQAEDAGYIFEDTAPQRRRHVRWLFERMALGRTCQQIASREADRRQERREDGWLDPSVVSRSTGRVAKRIGVQLA